MKQYCRYCAFCCYGDVPYCTDHEQVLSESKLRHENTCKDFSLSDLGDVETGKPYSPRKVKDGAPDGWVPGGVQVTLWDKEG